jgi:hypothetical protein
MSSASRSRKWHRTAWQSIGQPSARRKPDIPFALPPGGIESTVRYLGIEVDDALAIAERADV